MIASSSPAFRGLLRCCVPLGWWSPRVKVLVRFFLSPEIGHPKPSSFTFPRPFAPLLMSFSSNPVMAVPSPLLGSVFPSGQFLIASSPPLKEAVSLCSFFFFSLSTEAATKRLTLSFLFWTGAFHVTGGNGKARATFAEI